MIEFNTHELYDYVYNNGIDGELLGKPTKYMVIGNRKLHAYRVTCEYIVGQDENGEYIIDPQDEAALFLEKEQKEEDQCTKE